MSLDCKHEFHGACIAEWFRRGNQECPLCRDVPPRIGRRVDEVELDILTSSPEQQQPQRQQQHTPTEVRVPRPRPPPPPGIAQLFDDVPPCRQM